MLRQVGFAARRYSCVSAVLTALCLVASVAHPEEPELGPDLMQTTSIKAQDPRGGAPLPFGVYDPHNQFESATQPKIEHVFVYWQAIDRVMLADKIRLARRNGRTLMVTVEPYTKAANWRDGGERLFADIVAGRFDDQIRSSCEEIASFPGEQWIRWGHEMEDTGDRYPWARNDPRGYVSAFRKFVDSCRTIAPRAHFIWSPKGERGLEAFYPGDEYVDMVGLSVWGLEKWDRNWYGRARGFAETFRDKYHRVEKFEKPVIIAELGVAGRQAYRRAWLSEILASSERGGDFPLLAGVVYFNDKEPYHWPNGYGSPDWRLSVATLAELTPVAVTSR